MTDNLDDLIPLDFFVSDNNPMGGLAMTLLDLINMVNYYHRVSLNELINSSVEFATKNGTLVKSDDGFRYIFKHP